MKTLTFKNETYVLTNITFNNTVVNAIGHQISFHEQQCGGATIDNVKEGLGRRINWLKEQNQSKYMIAMKVNHNDEIEVLNHAIAQLDDLYPSFEIKNHPTMKNITTCHFNIDVNGALKELGLSGKAFAEIMGVSEQSVSGWKKNGFPKYAVEWLKLQIEANTIIDCEKRRGKDALKRHMDSIITERNYLDNVEAIAAQVWENALERYEDDNDEKATDSNDVRDIISYYGLDHESVDQDEWMIYTRFHAAICQHSDNVEAYEDCGELTGDYAKITQTVAYFAMLADVNEALYNKDLES